MAAIRLEPIAFPSTMRETSYSKAEAGQAAFESLRGLLVFLLSVCAALLVWTGYRLSFLPSDVLFSADFLQTQASGSLGALIVVPLVAGLAFFFAWRRLASQKRFRHPVAYGYSRRAFYTASPFAASRTDWGHFSFFRETKSFLVLYDASLPYMIPKRVWSAQELADLRRLITEHVPHRRPLFKRSH